MAALLTATVRAPLTGMILVVEMTGSIELLFMMLVASLAAATTALLLGSPAIYRAMLDRLVRGGNGQTSKRQLRSRA
jgi:CIC family chloride channel protein